MESTPRSQPNFTSSFRTVIRELKSAKETIILSLKSPIISEHQKVTLEDIIKNLTSIIEDIETSGNRAISSNKLEDAIRKAYENGVDIQAIRTLVENTIIDTNKSEEKERG